MEDEATGAPAADEQNSGCQVDWSWLEGREIASVWSNLDRFVITFKNGETLTVTAATWKGQAFLAFDPWKPR